MNFLVPFLCWLHVVLHFFAAIGGLLAFAFLLWFTATKRGRAVQDNLHLHEERRCSDCGERDICEAAYSGVAFPCSHFHFWYENKEV